MEYCLLTNAEQRLMERVVRPESLDASTEDEGCVVSKVMMASCSGQA